jgi:AAHS family 4-hydroxybenzoate transporter-like MFS transporter
LAGFGLGGVMPNAMSLAGEKSPKNIRVLVMMVVSCGFTAGAAVGGFISAWMIPAWGWRSVFLLGGCAPILLAALMAFYLPESDAFLATRGKGYNRENVSIRRLFQEGRAWATILLWIVNFMNLVNLYFLGSWLPTVAQGVGYSVSLAVMMGAVVQVGGVIGTITNAKVIERFGFVGTLATCFAVGAVAIGMIGQQARSLPLLFAALFVAGWAVPGGQPGVNALAGVYYPTDIRSTGIGWGLGIGRVGAILGPLIGGAMMAHAWSTREVFAAAALPAAISAIAMIGLRHPIRVLPATTPTPAELAGQMH